MQPEQHTLRQKPERNIVDDISILWGLKVGREEKQTFCGSGTLWRFRERDADVQSLCEFLKGTEAAGRVDAIRTCGRLGQKKQHRTYTVSGTFWERGKRKGHMRLEFSILKNGVPKPYIYRGFEAVPCIYSLTEGGERTWLAAGFISDRRDADIAFS
jgi:hypothetical protein